MSFESAATASPFPSPSSSFLTPPTPGAHEFAVKPAPPARSGRKGSTILNNSPRSSICSESQSKRSSDSNVVLHPETTHSCMIPSPVTPTNDLPVLPSAEIPTPIVPPTHGSCDTLEVPASTPIAPRPRHCRPLSTISTTSTTSRNSGLFSSRPAPPSPGGASTPSLSRRPSTRSKAGSKPVSRANSLRKHPASSHVSSPGPTLEARGEGAATPQNYRVSAGSRTFSSSPLASPSKAHFDMGISASTPAIKDIAATSISTISSGGSSSSPSITSTSTSVSTADASEQAEHKVLVKIRDFAFQPTDERHNGQGPLVPKTNRVRRMNRRLGGRPGSASSISSSDGDGVDEDDEGWGWNAGGYGSGGFGYGGGWAGGRFSWVMSSGVGVATAATIFDQEKAYAAAAANLSAAASKANGNVSDDDDGYPSRSDMDRNFFDSESEEYYDAEDDGVYDEEEGRVFEDKSAGEDDDEPLHPGLYRALYAFEPEGTAEMRLVEDQIVKVVARGGGVGWAVVIAETDEETDDKGTKHALVPESYLEPYKLDWELEESGAAPNSRTA